MRRFIILLNCLYFVVSTVSICASDEPPMPQGYTSKEEIQAAMLAGKIKLINASDVPIPDSVEEVRGIEYGNVDGRTLLLNLYLPKNEEKKRAAIIFIHGGGWSGGEPDQMKFYAVRFAEKGYVTASIAYRKSGEAKFPAAVEDSKCAVRWLRKNSEQYNVDSDRIVVSGNSAGGHLSLMVGYSSDVKELEGNGGHEGVSSRVKVVIDFYGPSDLTTDFAKNSRQVPNFLNKTFDEAPELYELASPVTHVTKDDPPTLIIHGTIDEVVPIDQAVILHKKLVEAGVPVHYEPFPGWIHVMDLAKEVNDRCLYLMDRFLEKHL